jgi:hypothetical protein
MGLEGTTADGDVEMSGDETTPAGTDLESGTDDGEAPDAGTSASPEECAGVDFSTDPEHCGSCDRSCLGGSCNEGTCQPVAYTLTFPDWKEVRPRRIAADADGIYFYATGTLSNQNGEFAMSRRGEALEAVEFRGISTAYIYPRRDRVYYYTDACCSFGNVVTYDKATGTSTVTGQPSVASLIHSAWQGSDQLVFGGDSRVYVTDLMNAGHRVATSLDHDFLAPEVAGNSQYIFAAEQIHLDVPDPVHTRRIVMAPKSDLEEPGFVMTPLSEPLPYIDSLIADEDYVFAGTYDGIWRISIATGETTVIAPHDDTLVVELQRHADRLYWFARRSDDAKRWAIYSMPVGGGTPHAFIEEDHPIGGIWVDDIGTIWTTPQPPAVWQIAH